MTYQRLSHYSSFGGEWFDITDEQAEVKIKRALEFTNATRARQGKLAITEEQLRNFLLKGGEIECSATDWESIPDKIRSKEGAQALLDKVEAERAAIPLVKCDCGHTIPKTQVMSASMGSSCPDCYDRMSD